MPLQRQLVTIPFAFGVDLKSDDKQVALGRLTELENGVFTTLKKIRKRNGYEAIPRRVSSETGLDQLESASALTSFRDELLAVGRSSLSPSRSRLFSYSDGSNAWVSKGDFTPCAASAATVAKDTQAFACVDGAATDTGGLQVYAWERGTSVFYSAIDTSSGQVVVSSALVANDAARPRVVPYSGGALIYYVDTFADAVKVRRLVPSTNASLEPALQLTSVIPGTVDALTLTDASQLFDVVRMQGQLLLAFVNGVGSITVRRYNASNPQNSIAQRTVSSSSIPTTLAIAYDAAGERVAVAWSTSDGALTYSTRWASTDQFLTDPFSASAANISPGTSVDFLQVGIVAVPESPAAERFRVWSSYRRSGSPGRLSTTLYVTDGASSQTAERTTLAVSIASRPWAYGGRAFVAVAFESFTSGAPDGLQNQLLVVADSTTAFEPVARVLYTTSAGAPASRLGPSATLPAATELRPGAFQLATLEASTLTTAVGDVQTFAGITSATFDFEEAPLSDNRSEIGGSLVLGGGLLSAYDGIGLTELGFFAWPDECAVSLGGGGGLSAGSYQWVAVYEWTDNNGFVHRSAASLPATATATSGQSATVTVSTLSITSKQARAPVQIVVYRTLANGTVFYRASSLTAPTLNSVSAYTVTFSDTVSDATLASRPLLYTTGGVVENIPPGASSGLTIHRGRLWAVDGLNPLRLWYSRQVASGAPVEFSDVLALDVDSRGGDVVALGSLDDKLVVFKRTQIFVVSGQGPDSTGSQNDFSDAVLVTSDVGCVDARSLVVTPSGLVFQSTKGIYLLDRSLAVSYIGADVEAYNGATVESGQLIPTANQVRFVLSTGVALVLDFYVGQWSVFTNHPAVDSVVWLDRFCYVRADGVVMREDASRHDDAGAYVPLKVTTGWLAFAGDAGVYAAAAGNRAPAALQLYQRARRLLVLGEYSSPHRLRVQVSFDYAPAVEQDVVVTPNDPGSYGSSSPYGSESPYGGTWLPYQWRVDLARQKCQALKVSISEQRIAGEVGEGLSLSALSIELGLKPLSARIPMPRVAG